jgi:hypothetical protein
MGPHLQKVLKLLADNKIQEAVTVLGELEHQIGELEQDFEVIEDLLERVLPAKPNFKLKRKSKGKVLPQAERSARVKETARTLAKANSGKTSIGEIRKAVEAAGIELGSVPGTVIANVLIKSPDWDRIDDKGNFRYVGSQ